LQLLCLIRINTHDYHNTFLQ